MILNERLLRQAAVEARHIYEHENYGPEIQHFDAAQDMNFLFHTALATKISSQAFTACFQKRDTKCI